MVPTAMTGWDRRPRVEHPVPWERNHIAAIDEGDRYFRQGSVRQIARHVADMVRWISTHREAQAQTGLIYSWDEHDEGGSTLNPSVHDGDHIIRGVGGLLRPDLRATSLTDE